MNSVLYSQQRGETAVPSTRTKLRPDHALFAVSLSVGDLAAGPSLALLRAWLRRLEESVSRAATGALVQPVDFDAPSIPGLLSRSSEDTAARLRVNVVVPLDTKATFVDRAERVAAVDDALRVLVLDGRKNKPSLTVTRALPVFLVSEDARRQGRTTLMDQWRSHVEQLSALGGVKVEQVSPSVEVTQVSLSMEEVELRFEPGGVASVRLARKVAPAG
jgi:hypothetical protein